MILAGPGRILCLALTLALIHFGKPIHAAPANMAPGYYMTFMRMPVMELADWKDSLECFSADGAGTVVLWMAGAFRSKQFPITWGYNKEHKNVEHDFVRELIDEAHRKNIRILLGFTPFGYDGVNQFPIEHPELKALKADGQPVEAFGIQSWGWSLCPSKPEAQRFMVAYVREMVFDFYPNADGVMIESSDYNVCRCPDCGKHYYDREFEFVRKISSEIWQKKADATILVYPHNFTGKKINAGTAIESEAARKPFDQRWQLVFTPHSASIDSDFLKTGATGIYSDKGLSLGTSTTLREGVRISRQYSLSYLPSLEPFSYILSREEFGASHLIGKRLSPLGFDWMNDPRRPLRELPARVLRFAFREYSNTPDMADDLFRRRAGEYFFGADAPGRNVDDLFFLQECINLDRDWVASSPVVSPEVFRLKSGREKWSEERKEGYQRRIDRLREISARYEDATKNTESEMHRIASFIVARWDLMR